MKTPHDVILRPVITEDSTAMIDEGKYTFEVAKTASKPEIKQAVETLFEVKVLSVNTLRYDGKKRRVGVHTGRTAGFKKAVVTIDLNPEQTSYMAKGAKPAMSTKKYKTSIEAFGFGQ